MFGVFKALMSDTQTLKILSQKHDIDVRLIAPKGSQEYQSMLIYMKTMRDMGLDPELIAEQLAYNYSNYGSLTRI